VARRGWQPSPLMVRVTLWALAAVGIILMAGVVVWLIWKVPPALYSYLPASKDRADAEASTRTGIIAGLAGLAALGGLAMTVGTYRLSLQGQLTDRYTKAIEQLGDDKLDIRLGGIYALERLAVDSKRDHPTVVQVLSAFVRDRTSPGRSEKPTVADVLSAAFKILEPKGDQPIALDENVQPTPLKDVQAAITVLGRLPHRRDVQKDLWGANLSSMHLYEADMEEAYLFKVNLTNVNLIQTNLSRANLLSANLTGAALQEANLSEAHLKDANLTKANLENANLTKANLENANLTEANLSKANLTKATGVTRGQLEVARGDPLTQIPSGFSRPASWLDPSEPDTDEAAPPPPNKA